jgi:hypothetical protein
VTELNNIIIYLVSEDFEELEDLTLFGCDF